MSASAPDYFWAIRQAFEDPATARRRLAEAGVDAEALGWLRRLEPAIARFAHPSARASHGHHARITIPGDIEVLFCPWITERGVEVGTEIYPEAVRWTFAHRETQICIGGDVQQRALHPDGRSQTWRTRVGDVVALPAGVTLVTSLPHEDEGPEHAHVFIVNLEQNEPQTFYDQVTALHLASLDAIDGPGIDFHEEQERIELEDLGALLSLTGRDSDLPTWLRWGWEHRHVARAIDYAEGSRQVVVASPDRRPEDFVPWGNGRNTVRVNPLIAEPTAAVTDCVLTAGVALCDPHQECWLGLRGAATLLLTVPPLHDREHQIAMEVGVAAVIPAGARVLVDDASEEVVVRRHAGSCAHNAHVLMMERKLVDDGRAA